jgi:glucose uptake protein GlcU
MESSIKTNRLAIVSFASGLIAILSIGLIFVLYSSQETAGIIISITDGIIMPLRNLCVVVALVTGILALRQIKKKDGTEKGKLLAWVGIVLGAGWIIFGLLVGITFLLAEMLH